MSLRPIPFARPFGLIGTIALLAVASVLSPGAAPAQDDLRSQRFTTSDGAELHYLEAGTGPTLVFVPGWTMPAEVWDYQLQHFAGTHRVVALDPRGQGRSEKVSYGYHPSRRALDIGELLEHLGGDPAVVVGWSLGVQEVVLNAHEQGTASMRAAVLVDYDMVWENTEGLTGRFVELQVNREEWTRNFIRAIHESPPSEEYLEEMTRASLSTPANASAIMIANLILVGPNDLRPAMESMDRPVLFVFSDQEWAAEAAEEARRYWPDAQVESIEATDHTLFVDRPDAFNGLLEEFLAGLGE